MAFEIAFAEENTMDSSEYEEAGRNVDNIREQILDTRRRIEESFVQFAEQLHDIWRNGYFLQWGYSSFREYVEDELSLKYRRARYLTSIASAVQELGLDWSDVQAIGWTKARSLLPYLRNNDSQNSDEWLEYARESTVKELENRIKTGVAPSEEESDVQVPTKVKYTLEFDLEQSQLFSDCVEHAQRMFDVDDIPDAVESIFYDWMARAGTTLSKASLQEVADWLYDTYGVTTMSHNNDDSEEESIIPSQLK
jgi:hypothetical protein